jgi:hypothetical protein
MPQFAMIDDQTKKVANVFTKPTDAEGFTFIPDTEWADPEAQVFSGMTWTNAPVRPATFEFVEVNITEPQTLAEATARFEAGMAEVQAAKADIDRILSQ